MAIHKHTAPFFECECIFCEETRNRMKQPYIERGVNLDTVVAIAFGICIMVITGIWFSLTQ